MRFLLFAFAMSFMVADAAALTKTQKDAAVADAFLGVAEVKCGIRIDRGVYKFFQSQMHPSGIDKDALKLQVSEQDKLFDLYAQDPIDYCNTAIGLYGPHGTSKPGVLEPR